MIAQPLLNGKFESGYLHLQGKSLPPGPVSPLGGVARVPPAKMRVGNIGIQTHLLAFPQISVAVIVGIGSEDFAGKIFLTMAQALEILQGPLLG